MIEKIKEFVTKINGLLFEFLMGSLLLFVIALVLKFIWLIFKMVVTF